MKIGVGISVVGAVVAGSPADVTAPTLSSATAGTPTGTGATNAGVSTNEGNGTLYWAVVTNGGSCTDAQLKAGSGGNIVAGVAGSQAVSATGAQTVASITGLSSSTTYQIKFLHRDAAGNDSSQASVSLTTVASDASWASVVLLLGNNNAADGTTTFTDQSTSGHTITRVGDTQYDTAQAPTGLTSSILFDGTGDYLTAPDNAAWDFGSGDFTVEAYVRFNGDPGTADRWFLGQVDTATGTGSWGWFLRSNNMHFYYTTGGTLGTASNVQFAWNPADATWYHISVCRSGANLRAFVAGSQIGATHNISTATIFNGSSVLGIGSDNGGAASSLMNGWMASARITKGVARYTANFTPPTLPMATS